MSAPVLLDLFCGAGGAAKGYADAGFTVIGVDSAPQPRYPYPFVQADALEFVRLNGHQFAAIHASPPCQRYSATRTLDRERATTYPDLIGPVRDALVASGKPYVIENVVGAPLLKPIRLCGTMFPGELTVYRHRLFESNIPLTAPRHGRHEYVCPRVGRPPAAHGWMIVAGHYIGAAAARRAMGISWMTRDELSQAIPPPYTRYIGNQLRAWIAGRRPVVYEQCALWRD